VSKILALTGVTGKKSGGTLIEQISSNFDIINELFPDGIYVLVRSSSITEKLDSLLPEAKKYVGNLEDVDFLKNCLVGVDTLIHLAGIHWSREIVKAAEYCHIRRLILIHTTGIYSKYKAAGEEYRQIDNFVYETCHKNDIVLTICRPTMIYGNLYDNNVIFLIKMVERLLFIPVVNGARYELQPVHYDDLGKAYYQVLTHEFETANKDFILSGGEPILLREMLTIIGNNLGKKVQFINCPFLIAYAGACVVFALSLKKIDYREKVRRLCESRAFSHQDAKDAFGYNPRTFKEGVLTEIEAYKGLTIRGCIR
jgi:uncharacterized protein YbjT (DUF2867 family)